ncbi:MAG: GNAT family protein [Methylococcaceae bacterium]
MYISLRPWLLEDVTTLTAYFNNQNIKNNLRDYIPYPYSTTDAEKFIESQTDLLPTQNFAVLNEQEIVGGIGIILQEDIYKMNVELGYWIAEEFWGTGIATIAVELMTQYVFDSFTINRIVAEVFDYNKASMRVLEKNGYYLESVRRKGILKNDVLIDDFIWIKAKF